MIKDWQGEHEQTIVLLTIYENLSSNNSIHEEHYTVATYISIIMQ